MKMETGWRIIQHIVSVIENEGKKKEGGEAADDKTEVTEADDEGSNVGEYILLKDFNKTSLILYKTQGEDEEEGEDGETNELTHEMSAATD